MSGTCNSRGREGVRGVRERHGERSASGSLRRPGAFSLQHVKGLWSPLRIRECRAPPKKNDRHPSLMTDTAGQQGYRETGVFMDRWPARNNWEDLLKLEIFFASNSEILSDRNTWHR